MAEKAWNEQRRQRNLKRMKAAGWDWRGNAIAVRAEGWRTPLKSVSNSKKCPNQPLCMGPSAAKTQVKGNMQYLRMLFWLDFTELAYFLTCCCFTSVDSSGCCHWEPSASSSRMCPLF